MIDIQGQQITGLPGNTGTGAIYAYVNGNLGMHATSYGYLRKPSRPFFRGGFSQQSGSGFPLILNQIDYNNGNCWNASTGEFTCPIAGAYLVGMQGIASGTNFAANFATGTGYGYFGFTRNGAVYAFSHWNTEAAWDTCALSGVVAAGAGDKISFGINHAPFDGGTKTTSWYAAGSHGVFYIAYMG